MAQKEKDKEKEEEEEGRECRLSLCCKVDAKERLLKIAIAPFVKTDQSATVQKCKLATETTVKAGKRKWTIFNWTCPLDPQCKKVEGKTEKVAEDITILYE